MLSLASANDEAPDKIEMTMDNAALIVDKLCSDIKSQSDIILSAASNSSVITHKAKKIRKAAKSCVKAAGKAEHVMPKFADMLDQDILAMEEGNQNASENLQKEISAGMFKVYWR